MKSPCRRLLSCRIDAEETFWKFLVGFLVGTSSNEFASSRTIFVGNFVARAAAIF